MPEVQINYLAVPVAALSTLVIGALWYSPLLFGNLWLKAHGFSAEKMREKAGRSYLVSLLCYLVMAFVLAMLVSWTGVSTIVQGVALAALAWLGFLVTLGLTGQMFSDRPWSIFFIQSSKVSGIRI
jgi:hypothetical protein